MLCLLLCQLLLCKWLLGLLAIALQITVWNYWYVQCILWQDAARKANKTLLYKHPTGRSWLSESHSDYCMDILGKPLKTQSTQCVKSLAGDFNNLEILSIPGPLTPWNWCILLSLCPHVVFNNESLLEVSVTVAVASASAQLCSLTVLQTAEALRKLLPDLQ